VEITTLRRLLGEDGIALLPNGLSVTVHPSWIVEGEDRLSYTTLIRLIECCREHHWSRDILPRATNTAIDSITKSVSGEFIRPIPVGCVVSITYEITEVRSRGYALEFRVWDEGDQQLFAIVSLVSVFFDPSQRQAARPPPSVLEYLTESRRSF